MRENIVGVSLNEELEFHEMMRVFEYEGHGVMLKFGGCG